MNEEIKIELDGNEWKAYEFPLFKSGANHLTINVRKKIVDEMKLKPGDVVKAYIKVVGKNKVTRPWLKREDSNSSTSSSTIELGELETQPSLEESSIKQVGC